MQESPQDTLCGDIGRRELYQTGGGLFGVTPLTSAAWRRPWRECCRRRRRQLRGWKPPRPRRERGRLPRGSQKSRAASLCVAALKRRSRQARGQSRPVEAPCAPLPPPGIVASRARGRRDRPAGAEAVPRAPRGRKIAPRHRRNILHIPTSGLYARKGKPGRVAAARRRSSDAALYRLHHRRTLDDPSAIAQRSSTSCGLQSSVSRRLSLS